MTKLELAKFIVQELYAMSSEPSDTDTRVKRCLRYDKSRLEYEYNLAVAAKNSRKKGT
jgi:hypothetical protein